MLLRLTTAFLSVAAAAALTPEDVLSAPRRSAAEANSGGTLAVYSSSTYSFTEHKQSRSWNLLDLSTGASSALFPHSNLKTVSWVSDDSLLFTNVTASDGTTSFWIAPTSQNETGIYKAATVDGPVSDLQLLPLKDTVHFVFSSLASPNGTLYNPAKAHVPHASGQVYESLFVRHWDAYTTAEKSSLFSGTLSLTSSRYTSTSSPTNLLPPFSGLESPVQPFGGAADFSISPDGRRVAFVSKTPGLNPANNTQSLVYVVPLDGSRKPQPLNLPVGQGSPQGASSAPVFSPDGRAIAFLQMAMNGYEADRNQIYISRQGPGGVGGGASTAAIAIAGAWDVSPGTLQWHPDGKHVFATADSVGRHKLYRISVSTGVAEEVWDRHSVSGFQFLSGGDKMLLHMSSLTASPGNFILDTSNKSMKALQEQPEHEKHLNNGQVEDFWFAGANGGKVHGFIVRPSAFEKGRKYRMAFFIHGGPQGAWLDSWSTRWNPVLFAEQGWIAIAVNPTGSTGYGQAFVDGIQGQWGGKPYIDLELAVKYLQTEHEARDYIDFDNAVALGASYGGYMINYLQGLPLGRKFRALVCHDGVFSTLNQYSSEELYFPQHDFEGTLWSNRAGYERWDPARNIKHWKTPQMIIHGERDYRLPVSEGLAAFNVLQELGIPSRFLHFPDENHWVLKPENSLQWHTEVLEWINRWTTKEGEDSNPPAQDKQETVAQGQLSQEL